MLCPHCGHIFPAPSRKVRQRTLTDTNADTRMTDAELRAYYKSTAPLLDCAFVVSHHPTLVSMVPEHPTAADARRLFDAARTLDRPPADERAFWRSIRRMTDRLPFTYADLERAGYPDVSSWPPTSADIADVCRTLKLRPPVPPEL